MDSRGSHRTGATGAFTHCNKNYYVLCAAGNRKSRGCGNRKWDESISMVMYDYSGWEISIFSFDHLAAGVLGTWPRTAGCDGFVLLYRMLTDGRRPICLSYCRRAYDSHQPSELCRWIKRTRVRGNIQVDPNYPNDFFLYSTRRYLQPLIPA